MVVLLDPLFPLLSVPFCPFVHKIPHPRPPRLHVSHFPLRCRPTSHKNPVFYKLHFKITVFLSERSQLALRRMICTKGQKDQKDKAKQTLFSRPPNVCPVPGTPYMVRPAPGTLWKEKKNVLL